MAKKYLLSLFALLSLWGGCRKPGCLGAAGHVITSERPLGTFGKLILGDNVNVILTQGAEEKMRIEAPENLVADITSSITDGILTIGNAADCRWARDPAEKINVQLFFKDLSQINYNGSGNITNTDTLRLDGLQIETSVGAGNIELTVDNKYLGAYIFEESAGIKLHGRALSCYTYTNARGQADMSDFTVNNMVIEYGGLADTHVHVTDTLDAIIYYKGNIRYKGDPFVKKALYYSTGKLVRE
jgi:Putative auto-transporter adhesin, head GIN domain